MLKRVIFKTIILTVISIAAAASLLGCGPEKTAQTSPLRTFSTTPAEETAPVQSASAMPKITPTTEPQTTTDATSSATVTAPTGDPSGATVTAPAGDPVDATSSATVKGGEDEEDDD